MEVIGKSFAVSDSLEKVTGGAVYLDDLRIPGMLYGRILRSPHSHAKILRIDTSAAERLPGVRAVITGKDISSVRFTTAIPGPFKDKLTLAIDKVRCVGDEVAAVAAVDEETAEKALDLIKVDYQPLPAILTVEDALKPGAPLIHDHAPGNIAYEQHWKFGDVEKGFSKADAVVEEEYEPFNRQHHTAMGTLGCISEWDASGRLTCLADTQGHHILRSEMADVFQIPPVNIRVIKTVSGGAFGGRTTMHSMHLISAYLARKTGRPVKVSYSREEDFIGTRHRVPLKFKVKLGARKDGTLVANHFQAVADKGAYLAYGPVISTVVGWAAAQLYKAENIAYDCKLVYTNNPFSCAFRGFGNPQGTFALESAMDTLAEKLGIDPYEFRLGNLYSKGEITPLGTRLESYNLKECIEKAGELIGWKEKKAKKIPNRGLGLAALWHCTGWRGVFGTVDIAGAVVKINPDGSANVFSGASDTGQGANIVLRQVAAEELGLSLENVKLTLGDTDTTPIDFGNYADRTTVICGNAVKKAAAEAREKMLKTAGEMLDIKPERLTARAGRIFDKENPDKGMSMADVANYAYFNKGMVIIGETTYDTPTTLMNYATGKSEPPGPAVDVILGAQAFEIEVDPETGQLTILNVVSTHDVGFVINPILAEGQVEGGLIQSFGMALMENLMVTDGRIVNPSFTDYKLPNTMDAPRVNIGFIEKRDAAGPWGAKSIAEPSTVPSAAALSNAIYDAVKVRIKDLPFTSEKILNAIKMKMLKS